MHLTHNDFETLVFEIAGDLLAALPPELRAEAETVFLEVVDRPTPDQQDRLAETDDLLGLYEGVPLIHRHYNTSVLQPDRITLFQLALETTAQDPVQLREQIRITLIHELGHFFGFDEDELDERGWG